jgi:hypothetical protein
MLLRRRLQDPRRYAALGGLSLAAGAGLSHLSRFLPGECGSSFGLGLCTGLSIALTGFSIVCNVRAAAGPRASRSGTANER